MRKNCAIASDPGGYNTRTLNAPEEDAGVVMREITAAPFLADRRMVVVKNVLSLTDTDFLEQFLTLIEEKKIPESTVVVVWQTDKLGRSAVVKKLKTALLQAQFVQEFTPLSGSALETWVVQEVARLGGAIAPDAVRYIALNAFDMWQVATTLAAAVAYANGATIPLALVQYWIEQKSGETVFTLVEAIMAGDRVRAFTALAERREAGDEDGQIFGMLVWQLRLVLSLHDYGMYNPGRTSKDAASELGIHPFVAQKNWSVAQRSERARLVQQFEQLVRTDREVKTGAVQLGCALERFVAES
jgi:DNA polymerase-3 subunit delta